MYYNYMFLKNNIPKIKGKILILASLCLHSFAVLSLAAPALPDSANIPREPILSLPSIAPAEINQQERPAHKPSASDKEIKLTIQTFTFSGNQSFSHEQLSLLLEDYVKRDIGFRELNEATKVITEHYRKNGYFLAQAYLPAQEINKNSIEIAVLEGNLDELKINGADKLNEAFLEKMASYRLKSGDSITEKNLVRNVTLLNSLPAMRATAQLNPGAKVGSTNAEIELQALPFWQAYVGANTYGNRFTGREVLLAGASLNNLAGVGDQLNLNLKSSKNEGQRGLQFAYYTPVHESGTLLNLSYNFVDYKLGGEFEALKAKGDSQYFNFGVDQPIMRNAQHGLTARFAGAYKKVSDEVSAFALKNRRDITGVDLGLFGDWLDGSGDASNQLGVNLHAGRVNFKNDFAEALDETGAKTEGSFVKYNLVASRIQYFKNGVSIALRADYQATNKNLDSVEKMSIGGINRWRAFAELPSLADTGLMTGVEIRKKIVANKSLASLLLVEISPYGFFDVGRGKINQKPSSDDNHVKSIHYGLGLDAAFKKDWLLNLTISHQNRDFDAAVAENETRIWGQLQKEF
jgi:hemolysin activation/secretion protein